MFNKYYQDELAFLREMGKEFSQAYPALAHMLADRGSDPDVERLLEGFAFLAGRIRQKLDDEFPELTHALLGLLWPHYLRPVPSMSILEFEPVRGAIQDRVRIPRGTEIDSVPVEGTRCRFRTAYDVDLLPIELAEAVMEEKPGAPPVLRLSFRISGAVQLKQIGLETLRLFLHGDAEVTYAMYLWLGRSLKEVVFQGYLEGQPRAELRLPSTSVEAAGFTEEEALLPYPHISFTGFRLLQEYFALPQKFLFFDVHGLRAAADTETGSRFDLLLVFDKVPERMPRVSAENFRLYCTPAVNLFSHSADPIRLEHDRVEYRLRPASVEAGHYEVYSVDRVVGWVQGETRSREYPAFYSFRHEAAEGQEPIFYQTRLRESVAHEGTEAFVAFVSEQEEQVFPPVETVSVDLTCTNRRLPGQLRVGDIQVSTATSPEYAAFRNITRVTPSVSPPLDMGMHWRLISHLALNYLSLVDVRSLRSILELYNFQALYDRQAARENQLRVAAIRDVRSSPMDWLAGGVPVRGTSIEVDLVEDNFAGEGDLFLFCTILNELFALYASLNSFARLTVRGVKQGEVYRWKPQLGRQILI